MKPILFITTLLTSSIVLGQTKKVTNTDGHAAQKEVFYVLKDDKTTREGGYKAYINDKLITEGVYHKNQKDSTWNFYSGGKLSLKGDYKAGQKVGIWTGFYDNNEWLKYDYDSKKTLLYKPARLDSMQYFHTVNSTGPDTVLDRNPICLQSIAALQRRVGQTIRYPLGALQAGAQGGIVMSVTIDENGKVNSYALKNKLGYGLDEEVLKAFKRLDMDWLPGTVNGKPAATEWQIPVVFLISALGDDMKPVPNTDIQLPPNAIVITAGFRTEVRH